MKLYLTFSPSLYLSNSLFKCASIRSFILLWKPKLLSSISSIFCRKLENSVFVHISKMSEFFKSWVNKILFGRLRLCGDTHDKSDVKTKRLDKLISYTFNILLTKFTYKAIWGIRTRIARICESSKHRGCGIYGRKFGKLLLENLMSLDSTLIPKLNAELTLENTFSK